LIGLNQKELNQFQRNLFWQPLRPVGYTIITDRQATDKNFQGKRFHKNQNKSTKKRLNTNKPLTNL